MKALSFLALLATASIAVAAPAALPASVTAAKTVVGIISQDDTGYVVNAELIQHYTKLCKMFPSMGDKPGDGVFVVDEGVFHLDSAHFTDYVRMLAREKDSAKSHEVSFVMRADWNERATR
jgi:hypothetical protein